MDQLKANWEVGHTLYVTSQLLHVRFQQKKVRLVGLGFNKGTLARSTHWQ